MSTITKELAKLFRKITNSEIDAEGNAHVVLSPADSLLINNARIALESLEAEPVAWRHFQETPTDGGYWIINDYKPNCSGVEPLYAAPPAPSVDEDLLHMAASAIDDLLSSKDRSGAGVWADIPAKLRRSAMLQGADGNSPVIPDGWVACSERMPDGMQTVITSNGFDIGQGWWDGEGWNSFDSHDVVPGEVTHWMQLPTPPLK